MSQTNAFSLPVALMFLAATADTDIALMRARAKAAVNVAAVTVPQSPTIPHSPPPKPQPQVSTDARPVLLVTMSPSYCPPCEDFKRQDWSSGPFQVKPGPHHKPLHYPWIEWQGVDGKWWYLESWSGKAALIETWKRTQSKPVAKPQSSSRNHWPSMTGYRSRWTWPGDLRSHLRAVHGVTEAMELNQDQAEAVHDLLHEGYTVVQIRSRFSR